MTHKEESELPYLRDKTDPTNLNLLERKVLADYWRYRGEGEMGAERFFIRLCEDMRVLGGPMALRQLAERARADERKHGRSEEHNV